MQGDFVPKPRMAHVPGRAPPNKARTRQLPHMTELLWTSPGISSDGLELWTRPKLFTSMLGSDPELSMEPFMLELKPSLRPRSDEDWDAQRTTIQELYLTQDMTLCQVMAAMKERGFPATSVDPLVPYFPNPPPNLLTMTPLRTESGNMKPDSRDGASERKQQRRRR